MIDNVVYENQSMSLDAVRALIRRLRAKLPDNVVIRNIVDEGHTLSIDKKKGGERDTGSGRHHSPSKAARRECQAETGKKFLLKRSITDPLTGLYNRLRIRELFLDEKQHFINDGTPLSLMLKDALRSNDIIGRWGGEEFIILLRQTTLEQAKKVTNTLKEKIAEIDCPLVGPRTASFGPS